jgi:hypothetical protein
VEAGTSKSSALHHLLELRQVVHERLALAAVEAQRALAAGLQLRARRESPLADVTSWPWRLAPRSATRRALVPP